jgi:hypothetical protein
MFVRHLMIFLAAVCAGAEDAREIVRRSVDVGDENLKIAGNYTFRERAEAREFDGSGRISKTGIETHDVTLVDGSPYRRLLSRDDKPLPGKEERKEQQKLDKIAAERRKETPAQREKRLADHEKKRREERALFREAADAFDFRLAGEDQLEGREQYIIDGTPHPGYKPRSRRAAFFAKVKGRLWIDKRDYHWVKLEVEVIDTVSVGAFLFRLAKGSHLEVEQTRVNDEVWLPKRMEIGGSARVALLKRYRGQVEVTFSDYTKFQTDSRIVSVDW